MPSNKGPLDTPPPAKSGAPAVRRRLAPRGGPVPRRRGAGRADRGPRARRGPPAPPRPATAGHPPRRGPSTARPQPPPPPHSRGVRRSRMKPSERGGLPPPPVTVHGGWGRGVPSWGGAATPGGVSATAAGPRRCLPPTARGGRGVALRGCTCSAARVACGLQRQQPFGGQQPTHPPPCWKYKVKGTAGGLGAGGAGSCPVPDCGCRAAGDFCSSSPCCCQGVDGAGGRRRRRRGGRGGGCPMSSREHVF